jgi:hypothetical protein
MIELGQENNRFARALQDEILRPRLMAEYARKIKTCAWAAALQAAIAFVLFLIPGTENAHYVFLCVGLGFLLICFRLRRDLNQLRLADRQAEPEPAAERLAQ